MTDDDQTLNFAVNAVVFDPAVLFRIVASATGCTAVGSLGFCGHKKWLSGCTTLPHSRGMGFVCKLV